MNAFEFAQQFILSYLTVSAAIGSLMAFAVFAVAKAGMEDELDEDYREMNKVELIAAVIVLWPAVLYRLAKSAFGKES